MTDRPRLLSGLLARRTDLAEEVSKVEAQLRQHYETLRSLDHLIRLEDPEVDLPPIRNTKLSDKAKTSSTLVRGDVSRLCLDALREAAGTVLTSRQVTDYLVRRRQLVFATKREDWGVDAKLLAKRINRGTLPLSLAMAVLVAMGERELTLPLPPKMRKGQPG